MTLSTQTATRHPRPAPASHARPHAKAAPAASFADASPDSVQVASPAAAAQAAQSPLLDPAVQFGLITGLEQAVGSSKDNNIPLITVDADMGNKGTINYQIDLKNTQQPLSSGGTYDGKPSQAQATSGSKAKSLTTRAGNLQYTDGPDTSVAIKADNTHKTYSFDGKIRGVEAHLKLSENDPTSPDDDVSGFHIEGTLGGLSYMVDSQFHIDPSTRPAPAPEASEDDPQAEAEPKGPPPPLPAPEKGTMVSKGKLGTQTISGKYDYTEQPEPFGAVLSLNGEGNIAGAAQSAKVVLTIVA